MTGAWAATAWSAMSHTCDATGIWPLEPSALLAAFACEIATKVFTENEPGKRGAASIVRLSLYAYEAH